jgi:hypothetical protein
MPRRSQQIKAVFAEKLPHILNRLKVVDQALKKSL